MKKTCVSRSLLAIFLLLPATPALAEQTDTPKHCLWEVENGTNKIYLFGTIHFSSSNFFPLPTVVEEAFRQSESIMLESDRDEESSPAGRSNTLAAAKYPPGDSLKNHLSPAVYSNVQAYLIEAGNKGSYLDSTKPFMVAFALLDYATRQLGLDMSQSVDGYLLDKAQRDKKRVIPLESLDQKLKIFTSLNDRQQEDMLLETFREIARTNHIIQEVTLAWTRGETEKIDKFIFEALRQQPNFGKVLLTDRNKKWMPAIEAEMKRGRLIFVAVGLGHLLGKDSLVELLSKRGFKVRQL